MKKMGKGNGGPNLVIYYCLLHSSIVFNICYFVGVIILASFFAILVLCVFGCGHLFWFFEIFMRKSFTNRIFMAEGEFIHNVNKLVVSSIKLDWLFCFK